MAKVRKAIITAAGIGSRMKYITSIMPKAVLPLFKWEDGKPVMFPMIDYIISKLSDAGVQKFCVILNHTTDKSIISHLKSGEIQYEYQEGQKGFGSAVLFGENFSEKEPVFVHADDGILADGYKAGVGLFEEKNPDAVLFLREVHNPSRYGVVTVGEENRFLGHKVYKITGAEEKPANPKSNFALLATYIFSHNIFDAIRKVKADGEIELTPAINNIIAGGGAVYGLLLPKETWLNIGDPESYFTALKYTFENKFK